MAKSRIVCPACQSSKVKLAYKVSDLPFLGCQDCSMVFLGQFLTEEDLKSIYDREDYQQFSYYIDGLEKKIANDRVNCLKKELKLSGRLSVFDFGCGDGLFLAQLRNFFPSFELCGLDLSETAVSKGREVYNLNLVAGDLKNVTFEKNYFDLVTSYHVFEHLQNPKEVLKKIYYLLKPRGKVMITTPNENYFLLKIFQLLYKLTGGKLQSHLKKFYNLEHINSFTEKSLRNLLEDSGFKVMKVWQDERYFTKFCLHCFNPLARIGLKALTYLSKIFRQEAELTIVGEKI